MAAMQDLTQLESEPEVTQQVLATQLSHPILSHRRPTILGASASDAEAIAHWLEKTLSRGSMHTANAYRRELQRFLDWWQPKNLPLSDLNLEQLADYFELLARPSEHAGFAPQSLRKRNYTRVVLGTLFKHLQGLGHVTGNPFSLASVLSMQEKEQNARSLKAKRGAIVVDPKQEGDPREHWRPSYLSREALRVLWLVIEGLPKNTPMQLRQSARTRWLFILLLMTGLRRHETNQNTMSGFRYRDGIWTLALIGKGKKARTVTCAPILIRELRLYRETHMLSPLPMNDEDLPLVFSVQRRRQSTALDDSRINGILKDLREKALQHPSTLNLPESVLEEIAQLTPHRLRHSWATHRTHADKNSLDVTQLEAGHASLSTTHIYAKLANESHLSVAVALEKTLFPDG